ncbi:MULTISPECIES: ADP-forming succinate--CoA ligase subunit beta [unclassified Halanaerobium]|uniref:ADP-forming succinate--CoA ligase subunit beta n=1 Tax=unclassified Halanaerobium TaxID=2641197 RepID=UPI000E1312E8|nr:MULTISPECIES: ADP-forming succinate--CoA ligase subunit beta [unclassified Halanaerobium]RCW40319.1 succinyl-CoA synthetase (ADP-forming) beta subunit [Halanaerobium sp. MA284_MarDTE_T2]RCW78080.1 succinyl-CoA synthetase (ADP-forming) beta subunit [Halanaerobium sp. DL-01]
MKIYEYQAKEVFAENGIETPSGQLALSVKEAVEKAEELDYKVALKSQVHVGGRGKAGGIKFASTKEEVEKMAEDLFNMKIKGEEVNRLLIEEQQEIKEEYYLGLTLNRSKKTDTLIFSRSGGMDIEEVAAETPEKVVKVDIDPVLGLQNFHLTPVAKAFDFDKEMSKKVAPIVKKLYEIYKNSDCLLVEINPLALLTDGSVKALDGKLEMDDNARYRQPKLLTMWDEEKEEEMELIGRQAGFVVIKLSGNVSIISNGAGLAISTLDSLQRHGINAANILDLSGGATSEKVQKAVDVVLQDSDVKSILFNIFGGITRCDEIAAGVSASLKKVPADISIVCRLQGTNREEGIKILKEAGLEAASDLEEVVEKVVKTLKGGE